MEIINQNIIDAKSNAKPQKKWRFGHGLLLAIIISAAMWIGIFIAIF